MRLSVSVSVSPRELGCVYWKVGAQHYQEWLRSEIKYVLGYENLPSVS